MIHSLSALRDFLSREFLKPLVDGIELALEHFFMIFQHTALIFRACLLQATTPSRPTPPAHASFETATVAKSPSEAMSRHLVHRNDLRIARTKACTICGSQAKTHWAGFISSWHNN
jgi:hypothetical protein